MDKHDEWFADNVLPLEGALSAYLRRVWPDPHEVADLRQEVYVRVYEAARVTRPAVIKYYVFSVARNLLIDRLRHKRVVTIDLMADLEALNVLSNEVPADRVLSGREELRRLQAALDRLPPRCRETFVLRKVEGLSQKLTAARMGVSVHTVEKQIVKAMRFLADEFWGGDASREESDCDMANGTSEGDEHRGRD